MDGTVQGMVMGGRPWAAPEAAWGSAEPAEPSPACQATLRNAIACAGVGLHGGRRTALRLLPAAPFTGIVFRRTDLGHDIPARWDKVVDTRLCTVVADPDRPEARVGTIEHLMAAFAAADIDNAVVEVDGPELPILDGSAEPFLFLLDCAGRHEQLAERPTIVVRRPVRVEQGDSFAELRPLPRGTIPRCEFALSIAFAAPAIGRQALSFRLGPRAFRREVAAARTFTQAAEVAQLRAAGLALGGSLANAVVVDHDTVLNPEGLRRPDEFVRHKMLDMVGDLALAGAPLSARVVAHRPGHGLNNRLLHALFADPANWTSTARPDDRAGSDRISTDWGTGHHAAAA
jgi:UDP-3-O-[3-hydroxymyristoyl] N-acetylglucosamine deacetylase